MFGITEKKRKVLTIEYPVLPLKLLQNNTFIISTYSMQGYKIFI